MGPMPRALFRMFPAAPIFAVGYSLGALLLTKYLAEADSGRWAQPPASGAESLAGEPQASEGVAPVATDRVDEAAYAARNGTEQGTSSVLPGTSAASVEPWPSCVGSMLAGAVTISNPFCMTTSSERLSKPWTVAWLYNLILTFRLRGYIQEHKHQVELLQDIKYEEIAAARTLKEFDTAATCKGTGYASAEEYYEAGSSARYIPQIRTPSLFIVSEDDPLVGRIPIAECRLNPSCILAVTKVGGHCAHLQGVWPLGMSWAEKVAMQFFGAIRPAEGCDKPHPNIQDELLAGGA